MASNVFTKKEILQQLASRGYFIDIYTLDAFFAKKKLEAIFEDSQGNEFFDQNAVNTVLEGLFNQAQTNTQTLLSTPSEPSIVPPPIQNASEPITSNTEVKLDDSDTVDILSNISLSDGTPLIDKVQDVQNAETPQVSEISNEQIEQPSTEETKNPVQFNFDPIQSAPENSENIEIEPNKEAIQNDIILGQKEEIDVPQDAFKDDMFDSTRDEIFTSDIQTDIDNTNFDDITLLSESMEAQEKLRQYVVSELSKKNMDVTPQKSAFSPNNEFKLDISERTLNMIARTMAKKIAKYVGSIMAQDAKQSSKVAEFQEENRRLTQKARELEEQNRKLRLLLAESNKNLNSYKPSFFGLYKKVDPKQSKK